MQLSTTNSRTESLENLIKSGYDVLIRKYFGSKNLRGIEECHDVFLFSLYSSGTCQTHLCFSYPTSESVDQAVEHLL